MLLWNLRVRNKETDRLAMDVYFDDPGLAVSLKQEWAGLKKADIFITAISAE